MRDALRLIARLTVVASILLALLHLAPRLQVLAVTVVIAASLIPFGLPLAAVALSALALTRARLLVLVLACAVLVAHIVITRPYWPGSSPAPSSDPITVMTMNMRCNSPGDDELAELIRASDPDLVVVHGLGRRSRAELTDELARSYPTAAFTPMPGFPECGTVVFTRLPLDGWVSAQRYPTAFVRAPGFEFALIAVDLPTPTDGIGPWLNAFDGLIADVPALEGRHVMAVGDFNAVLEHEPMRRLIRDTGLRDAVTSSGLGWLPTFPDDGVFPPLVALDHVLVSPDLVASRAWTEAVPGQEHRALIVKVGVTG